MNLTKDDIAAIEKALQPKFDRLEKKISDVETKLSQKMSRSEERIIDSLLGIPELMHRDFPTREEVTKGLDAFKARVEAPATP